jgi:hypothetical protein
VAGILALLAFALAFVFHGAGFGKLGPWLDWQGLMLLGFALLTFPSLVALRNRVTPPQP